MALTTLYLDLNSYFASVEQQTRPELRGRPVAVVPSLVDTTFCIAASIEAKRRGVKTLTMVRDAKRICPEIELVDARPRLYVQYHHKIVEAVETCLPVRAVHSIDEMSCRLSPLEREAGPARALALRVKAAICGRVGNQLKCSIGLAPNRFLAKVGTDMQKPDGLVVLDTPDLPQALFGLKLRDLPGIGARMEERLNKKGITTVEQMCAMSAGTLGAAWESVVGRMWWHWLHGHDTPDVATRRRSVGHQHVLPPVDRTDERARAIVVRLLHKAAARMRHMGYGANRLTVWVRTVDGLAAAREAGVPASAGRGYTPRRARPWSADAVLPEACTDTLAMIAAVTKLWDGREPGMPFAVGVTLHDLVPADDAARPLFDGEGNRARLARAIDRLDAKYGRHTVYTGAMHDARDKARGGIAFKYVPDLAVPDTLGEDEETGGA